MAVCRIRAPVVETMVIRIVSGFAFLMGVLTGCGEDAAALRDRDSAPAATWVGRAVCARCHEEEDERWTGSHHDLAMAKATPQTVLADFSGTALTHFGTTSTFTRRGDRFFVETDGKDGESHEFEVSYTFGSDPLQQYLVKFPDGRFQVLPTCWDSRPKSAGGQRWFHIYPNEAIPSTDALHWTGPNQNWNFMCASCHSTNLRRDYDPSANRFATVWNEIDVSCEACHGPGSRHVRWAESREVSGGVAEPYGDAHGADLLVSLRGLPIAKWVQDKATGSAKRDGPRPSGAQVATCAPCHSRRAVIKEPHGYGERFLDGYRPEVLREGLYHADGQIQDEVYVWGSFVQSRMYHEGVVCTDCHDPHSAGLRTEGNGLCYRCHLPERFDVTAHHHHEPGSAGAQCVACHMPTRTYMVVDPRRDHSIRIPRPDLSVTLPVPNACNGCHDDKDAAWAAAATKSWYGVEKRRPHFGEALHAGRVGAINAGPRLHGLLRDGDAPGIARATAVGLLRNLADPRLADALRQAAADGDALVRQEAAAALASLPDQERVVIGGPLLDDPVRGVRMEAARRLASAPSHLFSAARAAARARGLREWIAAQELFADRPWAHVNLALLHIERGERAAAQTRYERALALDPNALDAWVNLADLQRELSADADCERTLRKALVRFPGAPALHHALGLALVRLRRAPEALVSLRRAWESAPGDVGYSYVYGVALNSLGQPDEAIRILEDAHTRRPTNRELLHGLVTILRDCGRTRDALRYARVWQKLDPTNSAVEALIKSLEQAR